MIQHTCHHQVAIPQGRLHGSNGPLRGALLLFFLLLLPFPSFSPPLSPRSPPPAAKSQKKATQTANPMCPFVLKATLESSCCAGGGGVRVEGGGGGTRRTLLEETELFALLHVLECD